MLDVTQMLMEPALASLSRFAALCVKVAHVNIMQIPWFGNATYFCLQEYLLGGRERGEEIASSTLSVYEWGDRKASVQMCCIRGMLAAEICK